MQGGVNKGVKLQAYKVTRAPGRRAWLAVFGTTELNARVAGDRRTEEPSREWAVRRSMVRKAVWAECVGREVGLEGDKESDSWTKQLREYFCLF